MGHIAGADRAQMLLLPEAVEDYVDEANPVRFIDAFVDGLDLSEAGFARVEAGATGRPGYAPADLLKLYIYGYLSRVRSSWRLEAEARRNIEVIWLLRGLRPSFKTIADFRRENRAAFRAVFREFVPLVPLVPRARPVRPRAACSGWHADQGGEQQGPQLHARRSDDVPPGGGREAGKVHEAAR